MATGSKNQRQLDEKNKWKGSTASSEFPTGSPDIVEQTVHTSSGHCPEAFRGRE